MNKYLLHWKYGEIQEVWGETIYDACERAGLGGGAIRALDYWERANNPMQATGLPPADTGEKSLSSDSSGEGGESNPPRA